MTKMDKRTSISNHCRKYPATLFSAIFHIAEEEVHSKDDSDWHVRQKITRELRETILVRTNTVLNPIKEIWEKG